MMRVAAKKLSLTKIAISRNPATAGSVPGRFRCADETSERVGIMVINLYPACRVEWRGDDQLHLYDNRNLKLASLKIPVPVGHDGKKITQLQALQAWLHY